MSELDEAQVDRIGLEEEAPEAPAEAEETDEDTEDSEDAGE